MIDLYTWPTPNGQKVQIMLEEIGAPYRVHPVDIGRGEQFRPEFLRISPNNKVPAIVDPGVTDGAPGGAPVAVFESGAILLHLAETSGRLLPTARGPRSEVMQWLMFQMSAIGPMFGQLSHFRNYAGEPVPYALARYEKEVQRLYGVLDARLADRPHVAAWGYSIADIALFPFVMRFERLGIAPAAYPHVSAWVARLAARPAVQRGLAVLIDRRRAPDAETRENFFGDAQYRRRPS
jgi:GST-like protein